MTRSNEIIDWWKWRSIYMPKEKLPEIRAIDILTQLQRGKRIEHDRVVITGNLGILTSEMHTISSPIIITNSFIQGKVTFEEILFNEAVDFRGTTFENEVSFMGSIFRQQCIFECAHFLEATHFSDKKPQEDKHARFFGQSNFKQTVFEKYVDFSKVEFEQSAEFGSHIPGESIKSKSIFKGNNTYFEGAKFKLLAHFEECEFKNSTYFTRAIFSREAYFR